MHEKQLSRTKYKIGSRIINGNLYFRAYEQVIDVFLREKCTSTRNISTAGAALFHYTYNENVIYTNSFRPN